MSVYTSVGATATMTVSATGTDWAPLDPMAKALRITRDNDGGPIYMKFAPAQYNYSTNTVISLNSSSYAATTADFVLPDTSPATGYIEVVEISGQAAVYVLGGTGVAADTIVTVGVLR